MLRKYQTLLILAGTFVINISVFAQENPWITNSKTENPWATEKSSEEKKQIQEIVSDESDSSAIELDEPVSLPTKEVTVIERGSYSSLVLIEREARVTYPARGAFAGSFVTALALNIFAIPINTLIATAPSRKANNYKESFAEQNPDATPAEKRAFQKGIRKKRAGRAAAGTGYGILAQILLIISFS